MTISKFIFFLFAVTLLFASNNIRTVVAIGYGLTPEKAIQNALKQAVNNVVGSFVVTEEIIKNDKLIKNEILSVSNGFIKRYQVLNKEKKDGIYEVTIKADVITNTLLHKLELLSFKLKDLENDNFKEIVLNKIDNYKNFKKLAEKIIFKPIVKGTAFNIEILNLKLIKIMENKAMFMLLFSFKIRKNYYDNVVNFISHFSKETKCPSDYYKFNNFFVLKEKEGCFLRNKKCFKLTETKFDILRNLQREYLFNEEYYDHTPLFFKILFYNKNKQKIKRMWVYPTDDGYNGRKYDFYVLCNNKLKIDSDFIRALLYSPIIVKDSLNIYFGWKKPIKYALPIYLTEKEIKQIKYIRIKKVYKK